MSDCLDKNMAIDAVQRIEPIAILKGGDVVVRLSAVEHVLHNLPTIQHPNWIPVAERLPEDECKVYWVCTDTEYQCECRWTNVNHLWTDLTTDWHWHIFDTPQYTKVVAWMPLPKPYTERRQDEID